MHYSYSKYMISALYNYYRREALEMWKQAHGPEATYINLIGLFERAGYKDYADKVYKLFEADISAQSSQ